MGMSSNRFAIKGATRRNMEDDRIHYCREECNKRKWGERPSISISQSHLFLLHTLKTAIQGESLKFYRDKFMSTDRKYKM